MEIKSVETFLERNYIDPIILKYTRRHLLGVDKLFVCGGTCGKSYPYEVMRAIKYGNKQVLRCPECMKKYRRRSWDETYPGTVDI